MIKDKKIFDINNWINKLSGVGLYSKIKHLNRDKSDLLAMELHRSIANIWKMNASESKQNIESLLEDSLHRWFNIIDQPEFIRLFSSNIVDFRYGKKNENEYCQLIKIVSNFNKRYFPEYFYSTFQFVANTNGLYELGFIFRTQRRLILNNIKLSRVLKTKMLIRLYNAAMDAGEFKRALEIMDIVKRRPFYYVQYNRMKEYFYVLTGDRDNALKFSKKRYSKEDRKFAKLVSGKTIAVVGPAPGEELVADFINGCDLVVRTNYRGKSKMPPPEQYGSKVNISYYNIKNEKEVISIEDQSFLNDLDAIVIKRRFKFGIKGILPKKTIVRSMFTPNEFFYSGNAQMIQHILFDLLHFNINKIILFKSNFFYSEKRYYDTYYSSKRIINGASVWRDHGYHDLVSQLIFTQLVCKNNLIQTDSLTASVIEIEPSKYIHGIQSIYSY